MPKREVFDGDEFETAWRGFLESLGEYLLIPQPDDRPLDQFLGFRDKVLALVREPDFVKELRRAWDTQTKGTQDHPEPYHLLVEELATFSRATRVAKETSEGKGWIGKWLGRGSTVTGSGKHLRANSALLRAGLTSLEELIDLFE